MKKILLYSCMLLVVTACHKEKEPARRLYLSKVYTDALLTEEYIYSADKKPIRRNTYGTSTGQSVSNSFRLYDYTEGLLSAVTVFTAANKFNTKYTLEYDLDKRMTRMDIRNIDDDITFYYLMDYGQGNRLEKFTLYQSPSNKKSTEGYFYYANSGVLSMIKRYIFPAATPVLRDSATFSFFARSLPSHWTNFEALPLVALPNGDKTFFDTISDGYFYYYVDAPPLQSTATYSGKLYNKEGYLIKQQQKYVSVGVGSPVIVTTEKTYEYIE